MNAERAAAAEAIQHRASVAARLMQRAGFTGRDLLITVAFVTLFLVQLVHHNLWRDELNAFGIAAASPTLGSLFHLIHYEGHPWLWYVLLWIVSKGTALPWGMKVLEGLIGIGIFGMLGLASPFSWWEKVLLSLGYFITFEYTVMARMYGVMLLLALMYIRRRTVHPERAIGMALLLGLMASTDAIGFLLSVALVAEYVDSLRRQRRNRPTVTDRRLAGAGVLYGFLLALAVYTVRVASDISWRTNSHPFVSMHDPGHLLKATYEYIALPYFLAENWPLRDFWLLPAPHPVLFSALVPLVLFAYWLTFRGRGNLLLMMALTLVASVLFGHLIYHGAQRQFGVTFLAFLLGIWMIRAEAARLPAAAYVLLGLTAVSGILANVGEWAAPFSNAEPTVKWLQANQLADGPIVGTPDTSAADIAELMHRPVYMLDCNCSDTYLLFSRRRDPFRVRQIPDRLALARKNLNVSTFLFVDAHPLSELEQARIAANGLMVTPLTSFTGSEAQEENFFLYRIADAGNYTSGKP